MPRPVQILPKRLRRGLAGPLGGVLASAFLLVVWVAGSSLGYMLIEGWSAFDSLYMAVTTLSTVGYAEVHPLSHDGRVFTLAVILSGLGIVFYAFTRLGQLVIEGELMDILGRRRMMNELERLEDHIVVCGYGRTGIPVARGLADEGVAFAVVDRDQDIEADLVESGYVYFVGDATEESTLQTVRIDRAQALVALLPSDADNLFLTITAKGLNPSVRVIARASDEGSALKLKRGGADEVISPHKIAGQRVLQALVRPTVLEFMELVSLRDHLELSLEEVRVQQGSDLVGQDLEASNIRRDCGAIIVAIRRAGGEMVFNPARAEAIHADDVLVALGPKENLRKLEALCKPGAQR